MRSFLCVHLELLKSSSESHHTYHPHCVYPACILKLPETLVDNQALLRLGATSLKMGGRWQGSSHWILADSFPEVRLQTLDLGSDMSNSGEFLRASELTMSGSCAQIPCDPYLDWKKSWPWLHALELFDLLVPLQMIYAAGRKLYD